MKKTMVEGHLSIAHRRYDGSGEIHGHDYRVRVTFYAGEDAMVLRDRLQGVLMEHFDHQTLEHELAKAENLAEAIGSLLPGCLRVDCDRPMLGLFASWERLNVKR